MHPDDYKLMKMYDRAFSIGYDTAMNDFLYDLDNTLSSQPPKKFTALEKQAYSTGYFLKLKVSKK